jgi:hypothetical protein
MVISALASVVSGWRRSSVDDVQRAVGFHQPGPARTEVATADLVNSSLNLSNNATSLLMASASAPSGAPLPFGVRLFQ